MRVARYCLTVVTAAVLASPLHAQSEMSGGWRMVPMDPNMIMLPGLTGVVPVVGAFLPAAGINLSLIHI